ncbi:hypothetical protein J914_3620 [Acinetobacter baumannii 25493_1]|nr:hypothetical protein J922_3704 [Acinetobacter baumannii 25493_9]EYD40207.1 hypothetical protein J919_3697 [Acinetobacter baumannii 25493_6]EYD40785.1 hypothetical protein J918_3730 [Acinetobacter baumannii 25493_5]EYD46393.1 hypothetical protein J917_3905 [Acinetobacter baumannii 25493_4]EYD52500.1 hypothetical protein J916_3766 [Acinetobacter baumannii 25493_3]EYD54001.1 hypothetical protein J915_3654 [Acinetobacter baumannii 25493_2]EYD60282.1 hypothetical protein J914_3620 [Acinetobacte
MQRERTSASNFDRSPEDAIQRRGDRWFKSNSKTRIQLQD